MRLTLLAFAAAASFGCSSTTPRPNVQANLKHKTPVALEKPSISQKILQNRIEAGQEVTGKTDVEGALIRK